MSCQRIGSPYRNHLVSVSNHLKVCSLRVKASLSFTLAGSRFGSQEALQQLKTAGFEACNVQTCDQTCSVVNLIIKFDSICFVSISKTHSLLSLVLLPLLHVSLIELNSMLCFLLYIFLCVFMGILILYVSGHTKRIKASHQKISTTCKHIEKT